MHESLKNRLMYSAPSRYERAQQQPAHHLHNLMTSNDIDYTEIIAKVKSLLADLEILNLMKKSSILQGVGPNSTASNYQP